MNLFSNLYITVAIASLAIGLYVYFFTNDKKLKNIFLVFTIAGFYWGFTGFLLRSAASFEQAYLFNKIGGLWPFCIAVFVHFALFYIKREKILKNKLIFYSLIYGPALFFSIVEILTNELALVVKSSLGFWTSTVPEDSVLYLLSTSWSWSVSSIAIVLVIHYFLTRTEIKERKQAKYVFLGLLTPVLLSTIVETVLPILSLPMVRMTVIGYGIGLVFIGISIIKYDLFQISKKDVGEKIFPTIPDMMMVVNKDKKIQMANHELKNTLGYNGKKIIGSNVDTFFNFDNENNFVYNFEKINNLETEMITKTGRKIPVLISTNIVTDKNDVEQGLIIVARDISERKKTNEKLRKYVKKLEDSEISMISMLEDLKISQQHVKDLNVNLEKKVKERTEEVERLLKQKDDFINQLSHDLKNPLTPLTTLLPIIKRKVDDENTKELLEVALKNTRYMKNLVKKTLKLARLNSPNLNFDLDEVRLSDHINYVISQLENTYIKDNLIVENNISEDINVLADDINLDELLNNLLSNSIKYTPEKGKIMINAKKNEDEVQVSISDNGVGMSKEKIDHIFDEFYKGDKSRSDYDSSGLGLPICKRIVEKHGGKIWVESRGPGKGTTFYFTLKKAG